MTTGSSQEQPVTRDVLLDARLAQAKDTHRVQVRRIRIIPGHAAGLHVHNGSVVGSIVDGSAVYQVEGEPENNPHRSVIRCGGRSRCLQRPWTETRAIRGVNVHDPGTSARCRSAHKP